MPGVLSAAALAMLLSAASLSAQGYCRPSRNSNEAKLLAFFAVPLAFSGQHGSAPRPRGAVVLDGDLTWVPAPPDAITHTGACYVPKSEHPGLARVVPRPRLIVGLGGGLSFEVSYLPPVTVAHATPNLASVALGWTSAPGALAGVLGFGVRAHTTFGNVKGPITCPSGSLQQTSRSTPCYGSVPSNDTYEPNVSGGEVSVFAASTRVHWYAGVGASALSPRFQVGFRNLDGNLDDTRIDVTLSRVSAFAGATCPLGRGVDATVQLYSVPQDATTGRVGISWRLR